MYRALLTAAAILIFASPAYAYEGAHLAQPTPEQIPLVAPKPVVVKAKKAVTTKSSKRAGKLSEDEVKKLLEKACAKYKVSTKWIVPVGLQVAWKESTYNPSAVSPCGNYVGLVQFGPHWGGDERFSAEWSVNRFVKVYADGGKQKIRQHWKATVGGY